MVNIKQSIRQVLAAEEVYKDYLTDENGKIVDDEAIEYIIFKNDNLLFIDVYAYAHTNMFFSSIYSTGNAEEWGAQAVYDTFELNTVVVYDDTVFIFKNKALSDEKISAIRKALGR